jgi:hypothetical protein
MRSIQTAAAAACTLFLAAAAQASMAVTTSEYTILGFTADGKHVLFLKHWSGGAMDCEEKHLAVYGVASQKPVRSVPLYRSGTDCSKREITSRAGKRLRAKLIAQLGGLAKQDRPKRVRGNTFTAGGATYTLEVKGKLPKLSGDLEQDGKRRARVTLRITQTRENRRLELLKRQLRLQPVADPRGYEAYVWERITIREALLSPDGRSLALILRDRPLVISLR